MQSKRIALVTGANRGIGFETSRQLAQKGLKVLMGGRNEIKGKESVEKLLGEGLDVEFVLLDVTNSEDIREVKDYIEKKFGMLDILINNAAILSPEEPLFSNSVMTISIETLRKTFDVNFFAIVELTRALLPLIKKSECGCIVNVTSMLGSLTYQSAGGNTFKPFAYSVTKAALNQFTIHLSTALKGTPIKVNSAHPGWVRTEMGGPEAPLDVTQGAKTIVWLATLDRKGPTGKFFYLNEELPW